MRSLNEITLDISRFKNEHEDEFQARQDALAFLHENLTPDDPLFDAVRMDITERFRHITQPYMLLCAEQQRAYRATHPFKIRKDEARSMMDLEHPRCPEGERTVKDDWHERKDMFYGPGGKLLDEDKKIISVPGVAATNRASSQM